MVYDHHVSDLPITLMELQHEYHHDIISTMHIHLNHELCLEILVVRGPIQRMHHPITFTFKKVCLTQVSVTYIDEADASFGA